MSIQQTTVSSAQDPNAWTDWNLDHDRGQEDYCQRIAQLARDCAARCPAQDQVVDVGCGNGWLTAALDGVFRNRWACDISPQSVGAAQRRIPSARLVAGDFVALDAEDLPENADLVVSCEVVAHVSDQRAFFQRCRSVTKPGGRLLLLTQNPATWNRSSYLEPPAPGRLRHWPTRAELEEHFAAVGYRLEKFSTIEPHGDRGLLIWQPYASGIIRRTLGVILGKDEGRAQTKRMFEALGLGRTFVVEAVAI